MMPLDLLHDLAKEIIGALMVAACTWLGEKVRRIAKDINCYFNRTRMSEDRLAVIEKKLGINQKGDT